MIEWVKEMVELKDSLKSRKNTTFHDKVFVNEINKRMQETSKNYSDMLFREALRTGFFEMQAARDKVIKIIELHSFLLLLLLYFTILAPIL